MTRTLAILALLAALPAGAARADGACGPRSQPQSWEAVAQLARDYGWTIRRMEIDDGCYDILVADPGGNTLKATIDPATLDVVKARITDFAGAAPQD